MAKKQHIRNYAFRGTKCKKCGRRMTKLYLHCNRKDEKRHWIPILWYCSECDITGDRIKGHKCKSMLHYG